MDEIAELEALLDDDTIPMPTPPKKQETDSSLTIGELLKKLNANGFDVTRDDLKNWSKLKKIPCTMKNNLKRFDYDEVVKSISKIRKSKPLNELPPKEYADTLMEINGFVLPENPDVNETVIFKNIADGLIKKQKHDIEAGLYILREEVENMAFNVARIVRNNILSIPERFSAELASMTDIHDIKEFLYKELNACLEDLSNLEVANE